jgi:hypothetical protein
VRLIKKILKMRAVYWAPTSDTDEFGNKLFAEPKVIKVRWEERVQEFAGPNNESMLSNAVVYTDRDVELLGVLKKLEKGETLSSLASTTNPFENEKAWEVRRFDKLPTIKATDFIRQAYL